MARGTNLIKLLNDLRVACRISLNPAHNANSREQLVVLLQQKQEWFWNDFDWPHLRVERFVELAAGQRFYDLPSDLDVSRIQRVEARYDDAYHELHWGIGAEHYAAYDSEIAEGDAAGASAVGSFAVGALGSHGGTITVQVGDRPICRQVKRVTTTTAEVFASLIASAVNAYANSPDFVAVANGATVTLVSATKTDAYNGLSPAFVGTNFTTSSVVAFSGGVLPAVSANAERSWPPQRVRIYEGEQLEVWPVPDANFDPASLEGRVKVVGIRKLSPLVSDSDSADLDDRLLVLHCAAEYLAASGAKDAQIKLDQANALYAKLKGGLMPRRKFTLFVGEQERQSRARLPIAVYNSTR